MMFEISVSRVVENRPTKVTCNMNIFYRDDLVTRNSCANNNCRGVASSRYKWFLSSVGVGIYSHQLRVTGSYNDEK